MPYSATVSRGDGWVEIRHRGALTSQELYEARRKSLELLQQESLTRILVDTREADASNLSFSDRFEFHATHRTEFSAVPHVRIAVVVVPQRLPEANFAETVARNRGTHYRMFADWDEARAWLTTDADD
jgi:stage II sporulation SpoAA-like protein